MAGLRHAVHGELFVRQHAQSKLCAVQENLSVLLANAWRGYDAAASSLRWCGRVAGMALNSAAGYITDFQFKDFRDNLPYAGKTKD